MALIISLDLAGNLRVVLIERVVLQVFLKVLCLRT